MRNVQKQLPKSTLEPAAMNRTGDARYRAVEIAGQPAKKAAPRDNLALLRAGLFYNYHHVNLTG